MKSVALPSGLLAEIRAHARETYPDECCGFLIGRGTGSEPDHVRPILGLLRAQNTFDGQKHRRFLISPDELRRTERSVEESGRSVIGFYHSHPDHPARPSQFDQAHAWPWYTYLVLSVTARDAPAVGAFELDPETSEFREVPLKVETDRSAALSVAEG